MIESEAIPVAYTAGRCRFYVKAVGEWSGVPKNADTATATATATSAATATARAREEESVK